MNETLNSATAQTKQSGAQQLGDVLGLMLAGTKAPLEPPPRVNGGAVFPAAKSDRHTIEFTLVKSESTLTKTIKVGKAGQLEKSGDISLYRGRALRKSLFGTPAEAVNQLRGILKALGRNEAIICAPPPSGNDDWPLVKKAELPGSPGAIARTQEHFRPSSGPALIAMDFDTAEFPQDLLNEIKKAGNISKALAAVCPAFAKAACVCRASTSSGVRVKGADSKSKESGQHRYYVASDGRSIERCFEILGDRLMLAGFLWGKIAQTGDILPRTLFDVAASKDPSRLFYEADSILADDRLEYSPGAREPVVTPGGILDISGIEPLTDDERKRLATKIAEMKRRIAPQAAEQRKRWQDRRVADLIAKGSDPSTARKVASGAIERRELTGDFDIQFDDGATASVREILADPAAFHKKTCADPLEPDYNGGHNIAVVFADRHPVRIHSQAHGGIDYVLGLPPEDWFSHIEAEAGAVDEAAEKWPEPVDIFSNDSPLELATPPAGSLPDIIERWSLSEARRKGVSQAFAAAAAITVCAAAIGGSLRIRPRLNDDGWTEPAGLWLTLVADPGRAKSPTIAAAVKPLRELDAERWRANKPLHDLWAARSKRKGTNATEPDTEPRAKRCLVDNATLEEQIRIHSANPRGLLRAPDELAALLESLGAYKNSPGGDRSHMLRLFDGGPIIIDRVKSGSTRADCALMTVLAGTQPEKIAKLARDLGDDGMLQRFLFIMDDGLNRKGADEAPNSAATRDYDCMVRALAEAEYFAPQPVRFSAEAHQVLTEATEQIESLADIPVASTAWKGHVAKWGKMLPRIVLVFHAIECWSFVGSVDPTWTVTPATAHKAVLFGRFLLRHSLRFYETSCDASEKASEARWIAGHLLTKPDVLDVTRRDLCRARPKLIGERRKLLSAMGELETAAWVGVTERDAEGPKRWKINPKVHSRFSQHAAREKSERTTRQEQIKHAVAVRNSLASDNLSGEGGLAGQ